ncbi:MAG: hypothetical protein CVU56_00040 [Deltaproteobacteria bacterium HGW-Deltaproteobacteria-14]|nr:MAG: hypothetical protein CVU56_00040 [Deltaproteobacteria bacterium HGW-Deltaproteobacteria-14]
MSRMLNLACASAIATAGCGQVPDHASDPTITQESCWSCHGDLYLATTAPDHEHAALPHACEACHDTVAWSPAAFPDHDPYWPLTGAHVTASCADCHLDKVYAGTPRACAGCHQDDFDASVNPPHAAHAFPASCEGCHETTAWRPGTVDDHDRFWVLEGAHRAEECAACHDPDAWAAAPRECVGCHQGDYDGTTDPDHAASGYPTSCAVCHTATAWRPANFRDHDLYWPLEGHHATTACASCHAGDHYQGTPRDCEGCHMPDYDQTTAPPHGAEHVATACAGCHTAADWTPASFAVHDDFWPLTGEHAEVTCASCHEGEVYGGTPTGCDGCHHERYTGVSEPDHVALGYPLDCAVCHNTSAWDPSSFDHEGTWPLTGTHADTACADCHTGDVYAGTARDCEGCHLPDYDATTAPPHGDSQLSHACDDCHVTAAWTQATFDHAPFWALEGEHAAAACTDCHVSGLWKGTPWACDGCHLPDYDETTAPPHAAAEIGHDCETCHTPSAWAPAELDHDVYWPLTGEHLEPACADCHTDKVYEGTARACEGCHQEDYDTSEDPPHLADGYPTDCASCHDSAGWDPASFDHASYWPLLGGHAAATCQGCHGGGVFKDTPKTCVACHLADFDEATDPIHEAATFGSDCASCHTEAGWSPSAFDHAPLWPITGKHAGTTCAACHVGGSYAETPTACEGCHMGDYVASVDPPHADDGYPTDCARCHVDAGWKPASFDHDSYWPLLGRHATTTCQACHVAGQFENLSETCVGCHLADFEGAATPIHEAATFGSDCASCHTEAGWSPSSFDHAGFWPLTGRHTTQTCAACHEGGSYAVATPLCDGCHHPDYVGAAEPPHADAQLPTTCEGCHTTAEWSPSTFHHDAFWPLLGEHATTACAACHVGGAFAGTPTGCDGCHHQDYLDTTSPAHADVGFSTDCAACHSPAGWDGADFDHAQFWPLTGAHAGADCAGCHVGGTYAGTPTACDDCHHQRFVDTTAPSHVDEGFPTDCAACHTTAQWEGAVFDHAQFWPLTGAHANAACSDCHAGGVYAGTSTQCNSCHHDDYLGATNPSHTALNLSTTCQSCHQTSGWATTTFPGHDTLFRITSGDHKSFTCAQCHPNAAVAWSDFICVACHTGEHTLTRMNNKHNDVSQYATRMATYPSYDAACYSCHPTGVGD